ncbi:MAG: hypothetical protein R3C11_12205 [Planctomycetaceae bacterium]
MPNSIRTASGSASRLAEHGISVRGHHTVADDLEEQVKLLRSAADALNWF